ncbi:26S proteasome non-ATPase regulatory subunit 5 [Linum grandiflorum]
MDVPAQLLECASDFALYPGRQSDDAARQFLDRFPLPVILSVLQNGKDAPGLEDALVPCLERLFSTKYGASLIPHYLPFLQMALSADSQNIKCLACKTVAYLLENNSGEITSPEQLIRDHGIYPLLLDCLVNCNEQVSAASIHAITRLAVSPKGNEIIFPSNDVEATHLRNLSAQCSSLGRVRVFSLIVKLFAVSPNVASAIHSSNLLGLLEAEVNNTSDTLVTLSVLELFYELAEVEHGTEFLSKTTILQLLTRIVSDTEMDAILRSRAMMISGRLLSVDNIYKLSDESGVKSLILAIEGRLLSDTLDSDECESALEALGQIGLSTPGATLVLTLSPPPARHVIDAAFDRQMRGKQLAALHALGNISGESRTENNRILNADAEESLRRLIYETASRSSKLTPSGLLLYVLQQASEVRLAAYRVITGLVARPWCLTELCSKQEIINIVTDPSTESTKGGMEAKYKCCKAIQEAFISSTRLSNNPALSRLAAKLEEAVSRGPYLTRKNREAQPAVMTADRF